ncbi:hypothetical protein [Priestia megaterium]
MTAKLGINETNSHFWEKIRDSLPTNYDIPDYKIRDVIEFFNEDDK